MYSPALLRETILEGMAAGTRYTPTQVGKMLIGRGITCTRSRITTALDNLVSAGAITKVPSYKTPYYLKK